MNQRIDASQLERSEMDALFELVRSQKKPALVDTEGNRTEIPEAIYRMLVHVLEQMKQGRSITMMPDDKAFTTQAAANFLGVSRQHLVNMLEDGKIPYHKVGSHRRVYFRDLKRYADQRDINRRDALDNLFDEVEKAGKYDSSYTGDEH